MTNKEMKTVIELLKLNDIFSSVCDASLEQAIVKNSEIVHYPKDEEIFSRNNYRQAIGMVVSGQAQVKKGKMLLSTHNSGGIFGAVTLFGDSDYYATRITAKTACDILFINKDGITSLMQADISFAQNYIAYLSQRIYFLNQRLDSLTAGNIEDKLMQYIKDNAVENGDVSTLNVKSYGALAANLDSGRASLYRAMDSLTEKGIISRDGKTILLLKKD